MTKLRFTISISLDGFVAGPNVSGPKPDQTGVVGLKE